MNLVISILFTVRSFDQMFARKQAQAQGGDPGEHFAFGSCDDHMIFRYS